MSPAGRRGAPRRPFRRDRRTLWRSRKVPPLLPARKSTAASSKNHTFLGTGFGGSTGTFGRAGAGRLRARRLVAHLRIKRLEDFLLQFVAILVFDVVRAIEIFAGDVVIWSQFTG